MLKVNNINVYYGKVEALFNVSFEVGDDEIVSLIGANGAGKTTLMKTIVGINRTAQGSIEYNGRAIHNQKPHKSIYDGIVYVPEGREVFPQMTVLENLEMGAFSKKYSKGEMADHVAEVYDLFPRLKERSKQAAGTMSGGEQQMLAIGRGMMSNPKLLMFDEPSLGLAPNIVDNIFSIAKEVAQESGLTIILVEQDVRKALRIANRGYVIENGQITVSGTAEELLNNDEVKKAYLGF